jgi:hypothetical protein
LLLTIIDVFNDESEVIGLVVVTSGRVFACASHVVIGLVDVEGILIIDIVVVDDDDDDDDDDDVAVFVR